MPDRSDDSPSTLDYAGPAFDPRTPRAIDGVVGLTSGLQLVLGGVMLAVSLAGNAGPPWSAIGAVAVYAGGSAIAFIGSVQRTVRRRSPFYRMYLIGLPVIAVGLSVASLFDDGLDRDTWWQLPLVTAIVNPAWLVLAVGWVTRSRRV